MDFSEAALWTIVGLMLLGFTASGLASDDPNTSCLTVVAVCLVVLGGGLTGAVWGIGKLAGWW